MMRVWLLRALSLMLALGLGACGHLRLERPPRPVPVTPQEGPQASRQDQDAGRTPRSPEEPELAPPRPPSRATPVASPAFAREAQRFLKLGRLRSRAGNRSMACSELVQAIYDELEPVKVRLTGASADLFAQCRQRDWLVDSPQAGDLVFFDNTLDRNRNGRLDDPLTHVGVVTKVEADGRVTFVHVGSRRLKEGVLYSATRDQEEDARGRALNSPLRVRRSKDPAGTRYLAGQLLRGYCRPQL